MRKFWCGQRKSLRTPDPQLNFPLQEEEAFRRAVWEKNLRRIEQHNQEGNSFQLAMNHLGDLVTGTLLHCLVESAFVSALFGGTQVLGMAAVQLLGVEREDAGVGQ